MYTHGTRSATIVTIAKYLGDDHRHPSIIDGNYPQ